MDQTPAPACPHSPTCPQAQDECRGEARIMGAHPEQGWNLLCNGVLEFEDTGQLLPDGTIVAPHRPTGGERVAA
ncbi:DUF5999 family protein [Streptomyces sp. NPDC059564]|uniref:DUF5999 family protein n=1 Tax=Streptomyces sp. NPDC059564 TaxID=3346865 RepID=UPI0036840D70